MNIHSESIFHYTDFDTLKAILTDGCFRPSYCTESLISNKEYYVPMVSFCDIPLTQTVQLADSKNGFYGNCAIGMTKVWALSNGLNPVLYIHKESLLSKRIVVSNIFKSIGDKEKNKQTQKTSTDISLSLFFKNHYQFYKNFEGKVVFGKPPKTIENYIFYKEREWRYVPNIKSLHATTHPPIIFDLDIKEKMGKKPHFEAISTYSPKFRLSDISYLIVEDKIQKLALLNWIIEENPLSFTPKTKDWAQSFLFSNIFTFQQIRTDF